MMQLAERIQAKIQILDELNSQFVTLSFTNTHTPLVSVKRQNDDITHEISGIDDHMVITVQIKVPR